MTWCYNAEDLTIASVIQQYANRENFTSVRQDRGVRRNPSRGPTTLYTYAEAAGQVAVELLSPGQFRGVMPDLSMPISAILKCTERGAQ